jgi:uncharacterized protein YhbP (UPF0306 family)
MPAQNSSPDVPPHVLAFLAGQNTVTLATASATGLPHAATMVYASDGLAIYYCAHPDATTARHIAENPRVAFTIDAYSPDWRRTQGIQGRGECRTLLDPNEIRQAMRLFRDKFPFLAGGVSDERSPFTNRSFYRITPSEVHFINTEGSNTADGRLLEMPYRKSVVYSVFRELPDHEAEAVAGEMEPVRVEAGEVVVRQGTPADKFFIVVDGELEVLREDDGRVRRVATLNRGQFFGEIAILRDLPRTATVKALVPTTLLAMEREMFQRLVSQALGTTQDFDQVVQQRLAALDHRARD